MAKAQTAGGKSLVIVESPAKARTIGAFLGDDYVVEASIGHVRDLPQNAAQIPAKYKGEQWARLGVNVDAEFDPIYVVSPGKNEQIKKLKGLLKDSQALYLATDEDREGEAISWHLLQLLQPNVPVHRLVFHEITRDAIREAIDNPREVDESLVRAQEARRIIDRLYGYEVSPLLWRKVRPRLSAGRVQSVAVRLIVERERDRMAFRSAEFWDLLGRFRTTAGADFEAVLTECDGRKLPSGKDFDPATGKLKNPDLLQLLEKDARALVERLSGAEFRVSSVEEKPEQWRPKPPFTTSTMQQEANRKLGFTARRTMQAAQSLYENGFITYMRTDSTTLAQQAIEAARKRIAADYGEEYVPAEPRLYRTKVKNAQEAHEAIRPAGADFTPPAELRSRLGGDEFRLYDLIWKRTAACQMENARVRRLSLVVEGDSAVFQASGKTIDFPGYLKAYSSGDGGDDEAGQDATLPPATAGDALGCEQLDPKEHATQPPARFTEASLTRALEERGIGRPSTYASIIETILNREYVFKKGSALAPTWTAFAVLNLLEKHLTGLVDYDFTAQLEDDLDAISRGEREHVDYLRKFYFGDGEPGLKPQLESKVEEVDARDVSRISLGLPPEDAEHREEVFVRVGRYGPFLEQGERRASVPDQFAPDELTMAKALELLEQAGQGDEPLGIDPESERPVYLRVGRFGPYVQLGEPDDSDKRNASLLKGMEPEQINLETALRLLSLPRELGVHPESNEPVVAANGRYGPYVKCESETRSLPAELSPLDVSLEQALELLAAPKKSRRGFGAAKEPLKVFDEESPVTKQKVQLLDGRYGPYVTDGETNASLPKEMPTEELTFEKALDLLAQRAAAGGGRKKKKKKAAKKKAAKKASKKAAKKKTAKKAAKKKAAASSAADEASVANEASDPNDAPF